MASKIRLETDNQTRPGFQDAADGLQKLADKAGITANVAKDLSKQLDKAAYKAYREEVARLSDEISGTGSAMSEAERRARDLNKELESRAAAKYRAEIKALADDLDGTSEAARKAAHELKTMQAAAKRAANAMDDGGGSGGGGGLGVGGSMAAAAGGAVVAIAAIGKGLEYAKKAAEAAAYVLNELKEHGNEDAADLVDAFSDVKEALLDLGNDPVFREMLRDSAEIIRNDIIPAIGSLTHTYADSVDYVAKELIGVQRILGLISKQVAAEQFAALRDAREARDNNNATQIAKERQAKTDKSNAESMKKAADELAKQAKEAADFQEKIDKGHIEWEEKEQEKLHDKALRMQSELAQQQAQIDAKRQAALQAEQAQKEKMWAAEEAEMAKRKGELDPAARKLLASQDPRATREQFAKNQVGKSLSAFDADAARRLDGASDYDRAAMQSDIKRERAQLAKKSRAGAFRDFNSGRANSEDVSQAQSDVLKNQAESMRDRGKVDDTTYNVLSKLADGYKAEKDANKARDDRLGALESFIAATGKDSRGRGNGRAE